MPDLTIFYDGRRKQLTQKTAGALTPGRLKGLGVFETLLLEKGEVFFLREHYRRFLHGCDRYVLPKPPDLKKIRNILGDLVKVNRLKNGRIRLIAWRSGWEPHLGIMIVPRETSARPIFSRGFSAIVYPKRFDRPFQIARIKSLDYGFFRRACEYAVNQGHDEALLVDSQGHVIEGSRSNIFCVRKGKILTPALSSGCLAGVTREIVLNLARLSGVKVIKTHIFPRDIQNSDEVFLTNALIGIMPLTRFQGHRIASGRPGRVTMKLAQHYEKFSREQGIFLV